jgi:NAD(P)-dependent dehydrogenase (short-subunit alcohol dehydrogenase family)
VCDVSCATRRPRVQVQSLIASAVSMLGGVDVLVANAGIVRAAPFLEMSEDDFDAGK